MSRKAKEMNKEDLISFVKNSSGNAYVLASYAGISNKEAFDFLWELLEQGDIKASVPLRCLACNNSLDVIRLEDISPDTVLYDDECPFCGGDMFLKVSDFILKDNLSSPYEVHFFVERFQRKKHDGILSVAHVRSVVDIINDTDDSVTKHVFSGSYHGYNVCCIDFFVKCRIVGVDPLSIGGKKDLEDSDYVRCPKCSVEQKNDGEE